MELNLDVYSTFRILPLKASNTHNANLRITKAATSNVRNLPTYKILEERGSYDTLTKPSLLTFFDEQMPPENKFGIVLVFLVKHQFKLNLNSLKENIKSGSVCNLSKANLVEKLRFTLVVYDALIFDAHCDTLSKIPRDIGDEVIKSIIKTNPELSLDFIRENTMVELEALVPITSFKMDKEFSHFDDSVAATVAKGFEIYQ